MKIKLQQKADVNIVITDQVHIERLKIYWRRNPFCNIIFSRLPLFKKDFDAYILPVELLLKIDEIEENYIKSGTPIFGYGDRCFLSKAFTAGCSDYLKEPWDAEELQIRLIHLLEKRQKMYQFPWGTITLNYTMLFSPSGKRDLSYQEYRILKTLVQNRGQVVPREVLYYSIWGKPASSASRVIDVHISSIRKKLLDLFPASRGSISTIRGIGYLMD